MNEPASGNFSRLCSLAAVLVAAALVNLSAQDKPTAYVAGRPTTPREGLDSMRVEEGFVVDLVASEPEIRDPVAMTWDEQGRLYVVEMPDYPLGPRSGRVKLLEDRDGDGRYERSVLFAEGLNFPTGIFPWRGGVLVTAAPDILYLKDTDGDGKADEQRALFSGFGEGNPQHRVNGLIWGIDNWIYGANGDSDGEIRSAEFPDRSAVQIRRRDFRIRPDSGLIEPVTGNSQFGIAFDDWGNRFVCNNSAHIRHVVLPTTAVDRNPLIGVASVIEEVAEHGTKGQVFPVSPQPTRFNDPLDVGRFTAACGIHIYRGQLFPPEFQGNAFVCDTVGNLVHRDVLSPEGATFVARRGPAEDKSEFLASTDPWCRPVYLATGPDGALYVVDMVRAVIEHPEWIPDSIEKKLDLRAGSDLGRIYRVRPRDARLEPIPRLGEKSGSELVALLEHPNGWVRDTAQRLLFERRDPSVVESLQQLASHSESPRARLHALWTLDGLGTLTELDIKRALEDLDGHVREQALRLAEPRLAHSSQLRGAVLKLTVDPEPRVRFQLTCLLGELNDEDAVQALVSLAERDQASPWCRTAVLLSAHGKAGSLLRGLVRPSSALAAGASAEQIGMLHQLAFMVGAGEDAKQVLELLNGFGGTGRLTRHDSAILAGLSDGLHRSNRTLDKLLARGPAGAEAVKPKVDALLRAAAGLARDETRPPDERADAVRLLGMSSFASSGTLLTEFLVPREPEAVQVAAIRTLGEFPDREAQKSLVESWSRHSPAVRRTVLEVLFRSKLGVRMLVEGLESGELPPAEIEPAQRARLLGYPDDEVKRQAQSIFNQPANSDRRRVVQEFHDVLDLDGDRTRGEALFEKHCLQCHTVQRVGKQVGPELVSVRKRERAALLEDVLNPNAAVAPAYVSFVVATTSGRIVSGIIANETATNITLRRAEAEEDTIPRDQIEEIRSTGQSLMPEGLEKNLTRQEIADLIEYLRQIQ